MRYVHRSPLDTRHFFNRCVFVDRHDRYSDSFHLLAQQQKSLTFDERFLDRQFVNTTETPFREIRRAPPPAYCHRWQRPGRPVFRGSYEAYLDLLESTLEQVLLRMNPRRRYLMAHSSGSDSRILSGTMARLRRQGKMSFDNVLFHCWCTHEAESFRQIMAANDWTNISVLDDSRPDVYDIGRTDLPCEGWNPYTYQIDFWGGLDPTRHVLLSGAQETYSVPFDHWLYARSFFGTRGESIHRMASAFEDVFFPFLSYPMLEMTMAMPAQWKNLPDPRIGRDKLRSDLVARLDLIDIPVQKAAYRFNVSPGRRRAMLSAYENSRFRRRYGIALDENDLFRNWNGWNSCLWSFAVTEYEVLEQAV